MNAKQLREKDKNRVQKVPEEERIKLLQNLIQKEKETNSQFQLLSHNIGLDSQAKIRRKEDLETELKELEKAIQKLSKPNVIIKL